MPRIETEFEFDMGFCFGIRFASYAVFFFFFFFFFTRIYRQHIARPVESDRSITSCSSARPSVRLISVFAVCMKKSWVLSYPLSAQQRLIRLDGCPG